MVISTSWPDTVFGFDVVNSSDAQIVCHICIQII